MAPDDPTVWFLFRTGLWLNYLTLGWLVGLVVLIVRRRGDHRRIPKWPVAVFFLLVISTWLLCLPAFMLYD